MSRSNVQWRRVETALGELVVATTERGVLFIGLPGKDQRVVLARWCERHELQAEPSEARRALEPLARALARYAEGRERVFDFPLDLRGSAFDRAVWRAEHAIPYGETRTYADIARAVGRPRAARAVGGATGRNPVPILVPCHRVVASAGIGGFGGGLALKRRMLALEGAAVPGCNPSRASAVSGTWKSKTPARPRANAPASRRSSAASR